jgi:hypothetical protein
MYNPDALAYHQQYISFDEACRRARKSGQAEEIFKKKEAGAYYYASLQSVALSRLGRRSFYFRKQLRFLRKALAWGLSPFKRVMDWKIPLPWSVYRMMLRICR